MFPRISFFIAVLTAVLASQLPEFAQQYRQRLGGLITGLSQDVSKFSAAAAADNLNFDQAVTRLLGNTDDLAQHRAADVRYANTRLQRLERQSEGFKKAGAFNRILVLLGDFDPETAKDTLQTFEPAVPTTAEGLVASLVGFFAGGALSRLIAGPFGRRRQPPPTYAMAESVRREELNRAEAIRLRARVNKARLPRPNTGDSRDI